jgi:hypothetical protein
MRTIALLALLSLSACAETPAAQCPVAERGAWTVVSPAEGRPGLETADICDEQVTDALNYAACEDRASAFNAELAEQGEPPMYFVTWSEE